MFFNSPWFFIFLGFIPLIILMYMLKQKLQEKDVSSIFLWESVIKDMEVNTPWQKIKNNLLLIIQIIIIILICLAGANPVINIRKNSCQNSIIIIDNSGSMNASYNNNSRLEQGKKLSINLIKSLPLDAKITVISSSNFPKIELNSGSKSLAIKKIKSIEPTNCKGNISEVISMVKSMAKNIDNYRAYFYTDEQVDLNGINGENISLSLNKDNVSLDSIYHKKEKNSLKVMVRVNNRTNLSLQREISLFVGKNLIYIEKVDLKPKEIKSVYFKDVPISDNYIYAEITEKDGLNEDNIIYDVIEENKSNKVLMISKGNAFVEKALKSVYDIEVYKTESLSNTKDKYDLYIFDGVSFDSIPDEGNILFINPSSNEFFKVNREISGGEVEINKTPLTRYMDNTYFVVSKMKEIEKPSWAEEIFKIDKKLGCFAGETYGRKICAITFSLQNSDFPMTLEFPIFINNLTQYFLNGSILNKSCYVSGEEIIVNPHKDAKEIYINTPLNKKENINIEYPQKSYRNTWNTGIYTVLEKDHQGIEKKWKIAVNFPVNSESDINKKVESKQNNEIGKSVKKQGVSIQYLLVLLVIFFLSLEWSYYVKRAYF